MICTEERLARVLQINIDNFINLKKMWVNIFKIIYFKIIRNLQKIISILFKIKKDKIKKIH